MDAKTKFALQSGAHVPGAKVLAPPEGGRLITLKQMRLPGVAGVTIRTREHWPESFLDNCVATVHKAGVKWTWLPCSGDQANPLSAASLAARERVYRAGAIKYANDPSLYAVHACVAPLGHSEEGFFGKPTPRAAINAQKRIITYAAGQFPRALILWKGVAEDPAAVIETIKHGVTVAPGRFTYGMNAMNAKANWGWPGTTLLIDAAKLGANICYEAVQPSNDPKFGGTWQQFVAKVAEVEKRAGKSFVYEAIYPGDLGRLAGGGR